MSNLTTTRGFRTSKSPENQRHQQEREPTSKAPFEMFLEIVRKTNSKQQCQQGFQIVVSKKESQIAKEIQELKGAIDPRIIRWAVPDTALERIKHFITNGDQSYADCSSEKLGKHRNYHNLSSITVFTHKTCAIFFKKINEGDRDETYRFCAVLEEHISQYFKAPQEPSIGLITAVKSLKDQTFYHTMYQQEGASSKYLQKPVCLSTIFSQAVYQNGRVTKRLVQQKNSAALQNKKLIKFSPSVGEETTSTTTVYLIPVVPPYAH